DAVAYRLAGCQGKQRIPRYSDIADMEESRGGGRGGAGLDGGRGSCRIAPRGRRAAEATDRAAVQRRAGEGGVLLAAEGPQPSSKGARIGHAAKLDRRLKIVKYGSTSKGG